MHKQEFKNKIEPIENHAGKKYSLIASVVKSVARDRAISGKYGYEVMSKNQPPYLEKNIIKLNTIFTKDYEYHIRRYFKKYYVEGELYDNSLYADMGDLLGQLARLLIICVELIDDEYIDNGDKEISKIDFYDCRDNDFYKKYDYLNLNSYIYRLRNAVIHGHITTIIHSNWENTELCFWDAKNNNVHTEFRLTNEQLNEIIDIIIRDVCLKYLRAHHRDIEKYIENRNVCFPPDVIDD